MLKVFLVEQFRRYVFHFNFRLSTMCAGQIPSSIFNSTTLEEIDLFNNKLEASLNHLYKI
ncbi:hypothetical protein Gotur_017002 [Gossypium turneri]